MNHVNAWSIAGSDGEGGVREEGGASAEREGDIARRRPVELEQVAILVGTEDSPVAAHRRGVFRPGYAEQGLGTEADLRAMIAAFSVAWRSSSASSFSSCSATSKMPRPILVLRIFRTSSLTFISGVSFAVWWFRRLAAGRA